MKPKGSTKGIFCWWFTGMGISVQLYLLVESTSIQCLRVALNALDPLLPGDLATATAPPPSPRPYLYPWMSSIHSSLVASERWLAMFCFSISLFIDSSARWPWKLLSSCSHLWVHSNTSV